MTFRAFAIIALMSTATTGLSQEVDPNLPNPLRNENLAATCNSMPAQFRAADPQVMAALSGVWEGQSMIAGVAGLLPDTPRQIRVTNNPDGTFANDYYACFQPYGQQQSCAQSMLYGEWMAHPTSDGWIAVAFLSSGSGFTGEALPASCGLTYLRFLDANTTVDQAGGMMYRRQ